ncbi:glutathione peroxidase [Alteromonas gilva]|uniref:Glutathione peroxidase n=1 Tax=Alteromonas gilva TaxID=2987522 RepID=A0ABT5L3V8_9ALTE|nr:glutathione peroxidase [Alteromonas gilva]MDC8831730.1 glutathione peroxidase [Alteromonas gilva]
MKFDSITVKDANGQAVEMGQYNDKVLLIVNTASKCGFTPQYEGLQALYEQYKDKGLEILAFPCNQFGKQEPGDIQSIQSFCSLTYDVSFPVMSKVDVNGSNASELFDYLKQSAPGLFGTQSIKWNFTKFLISKDRNTIKRYGPKDKPESLQKDIEQLLA